MSTANSWMSCSNAVISSRETDDAAPAPPVARMSPMVRWAL
jgi:hypothetical protein